jgi:predicted nucleotidyltransferase
MFPELLSNAVIKEIDGVRVPVASIEHLIEMKQATGRPRDEDDVAKLRLIREEEAGYG